MKCITIALAVNAQVPGSELAEPVYWLCALMSRIRVPLIEEMQNTSEIFLKIIFAYILP